MDVNAVAEYLKQNPQFFEDYADMIAEIFVPHPHGGHAIPIAERQIVTLREKNHELETKLRELIRFGSENEATGEKLHRSTLALFAAPDLETTLAVIYHSLKEDFGVPEVAARMWGKVPEGSYLPELAAGRFREGRARSERRAARRVCTESRDARRTYTRGLCTRCREAVCACRRKIGADARPRRAGAISSDAARRRIVGTKSRAIAV